MVNRAIVILFILSFANFLVAQEKSILIKAESSTSDVPMLDMGSLKKNKIRIIANNPKVKAAYEQLMINANAALAFKPVSVMDKSKFPPSGDKHDYMSIAPYWWPDTSKPGGVPYIRKDGEINPEVHDYSDKENLPKLCEHVYNLSLAYFFSDNEKYARHASRLIEVWFLDPSTAMNPNLKYGQSVRGVIDGRAEGLIDVRHFIYLLQGVELLKTSASFKDDKRKMLEKWMKEFLTWMQSSQIGMDEMNAGNNHGVWYDATSLALANFIGDTSMANKIAQRAVDRLETQMDDNGYFPLELARTTSLGYSTFILDAFTVFAHLSEKTDIDFWSLKTRSGKSLKKGYEALIPYLAETKSWSWKQINPFNISNAYQLLWTASLRYNCKSCKDIIKKNSIDYESLFIRLLL